MSKREQDIEAALADIRGGRAQAPAANDIDSALADIRGPTTHTLSGGPDDDAMYQSYMAFKHSHPLVQGEPDWVKEYRQRRGLPAAHPQAPADPNHGVAVGQMVADAAQALDPEGYRAHMAGLSGLAVPHLPVAAQDATRVVPKARPVPVVSADTRTPEARHQAEAQANERDRQKRAYEHLPAPARDAVSAGRGLVDAATFGYARPVISAVARAAGATVDPQESMDLADHTPEDKLAETAGAFGGYALGMGALEGVAGRVAAALPEESLAARAARGIASPDGLSLPQRVLREGALNAAYGAAEPGTLPERVERAGEGFAMGAPFGALPGHAGEGEAPRERFPRRADRQAPGYVRGLSGNPDLLDTGERPDWLWNVEGGSRPAPAPETAPEPQQPTAPPAQPESPLDVARRIASSGERPTVPRVMREAGVGEEEARSAVRTLREGGGTPAPADDMDRALEEIRGQEEPQVTGVDGRESPVAFPDGSKVQARYRVVEANDIQPSHHPVSFQPNPDYPAGVQGRDYHRDVAAQERIAEHTQGFDPERLLDPTGLVSSGPPLVTPEGVAVAGNERTMLRQRIPEMNPEADAAYRQGLVERAPYYGIDPAQVEGMQHPMLVRQLADGSLDTRDPQVLRELNARSDQEVGKVKDPLSDAATRARQMQGGQALQHFAATFDPDQSLRDYLGSAHGRRFVQDLVSDGVIPRAEIPRYVDVRTGALNQQGTAMVERALYLSAVPDPDIVNAVQPSTLQKLEPAIPHVVQSSQVPGWNLSPALRDAMALMVEARGKGLSSVNDLLANTEMFGRQVEPGAEDLARFLEGASRKDTRAFFQKYAEAAGLAQRMGQSEDLFGARPPEQAGTFRKMLSNTRGQADPAVLRALARTGAGAAVGGVVGGSQDTDDPTRGALVGAAVGAGLGASALSVLRTLSHMAGHNEIGALGDISDLLNRSQRTVGGFEDPTAFHSRLDRSINEFPQERATPQQWRAFLRERTSKGEREWVGVDGFLNDAEKRGEPVTRQQIRALYDDNAIQLREVTRREVGIRPDSKYAIPEVRRLAARINSPEDLSLTLANNDDAYRALMRRFPELREDDDWADTVMHDVFDTTSKQAKYAEHQLLGGSNYREVLVTLPTTSRMSPEGLDQVAREEFSAPFVDLAPEQQNMVRGTVRGRADETAGPFRSSHWDEPNVLLHLRMNDRTLPNGEKVLFVEELQSDWHQKGRKEGYSGGAMPTDGWTAEEEAGDLASGPIWAVRDNRGQWILGVPRSTVRTPEEAIRRAALRSERSPASLRVPDAPFKRTEEWMGLGMKRVLDEAAANGYDHVAWTTGAQQADRYDLSKTIERVEWHPESHGFQAFDHDGGLVLHGTYAPEKLTDVIGKEAAERLVNARPSPAGRIISADEYVNDLGNYRGHPDMEDHHEWVAVNRENEYLASAADPDELEDHVRPDGWHVLEGEDLKVGGEGMRGFYDKMIPNWVKDYARKLGVRMDVEPVHAERSNLLEQVPFGENAIHGNPSFRITPELRARLAGGQNLGAAHPEVLSTLARAGAGAAVGGTQGDTTEDRARNAILGAAAGLAPEIVRGTRALAEGAVRGGSFLGSGLGGLQGAFEGPNPRFYSRLERVVEEGQNSAPAEQWLRYLDNHPKGIAKGEREWVGVDNFLREKGRQKVTREELLDYVRKNRIQVQEVVKSDGVRNREAQQWVQRLEPEYQKAKNDLMRRMQGVYGYENQTWLLEQLERGKTPERIAEGSPIVADRMEQWGPEIERFRKYSDALQQAKAIANPQDGWARAARNRNLAVGEFHEAIDAIGGRNNDRAHLVNSYLRLSPDEALQKVLSAAGPHAVAQRVGLGMEPLLAKRFTQALEDYRAAHQAEAAAEAAWNRSRTTYSSYKVPGGENYREVLLTTPDETPATIPEGFTTQKEGSAWVIRDPNGKIVGANQDLTHAMLEARRAMVPRERFIGPHWDEPNVLAHLRMDDRTITPDKPHLFTPDERTSAVGTIQKWAESAGVNGLEPRLLTPAKAMEMGAPQEVVDAARALRYHGSTAPDRVLFLNELQSDWHQRGRERGYVSERQALEQEKQHLLSDTDPKDPEATSKAYARIDQIDERLDELRGAVPDGPFRNTDEWMGLGLKRVLDEAVHGGYDRVAWARGEQISKAVEAEEAGNNEFYDRIIPRWFEKYGKKLGLKVEPALLDDAGEMAGEPETRQVLSGPDLTDEHITQAAQRLRRIGDNSLANQLTQIGLSTDNLQQRRHAIQALAEQMDWFDEDRLMKALESEVVEEEVPREERVKPNPSFRITPELRATVKGGQALYTFPGPVLEALKTTGGQVAAAAGLGAATDHDHPLRGALVGAGAMLAFKEGMVGKTIGRLAAAERRGELRQALQPLADDELTALSDRIRRWNPALADQVAGEVQERAARATLDPGQIADRDVDLLAKGPLKPLRATPGAPLAAPEREAIVSAFQQGNREMRHRIVDEVEQAMDQAPPSVQAQYEMLLDKLDAVGYTPPSELPPIPSAGGDVSRFVNVDKFDLDPMGQRRLADQVRTVVQTQGLDPKQRVTWDQTRALARDLGLDPSDLSTKIAKLTGAEMLAVRNIVRENLNGIEWASRRIAALDGDLSPAAAAETKQLEAAITSAGAQNDALLGKFIRSRSETGRDLNSLKMLANQTLDPVVWMARAKKELDSVGLQMTDDVRRNIMDIIGSCDG